MRLFLSALLTAALAAGAGWAAIDADAAVGTAEVGDTRASTAVLSVRRTPEALLETRVDAAVVAAVGDIPSRIPGGACLVVTEEGQELVAHQPDQPLIPASTQKLLVGAAVLTVMEPDAVFRTTAVVGTPVTDGVVADDLVIVGGGDPLLSTDAYIERQEDPAKPATRIEDLADAIAASGVRQVQGSVVGDGTRYDDVRDIPSWPQRYRDQVVAGPLSGLGVNDGLVSFTETEVASNPGRPASDPPAHTASVMTDLLRERGVEVVGEPRSGAAPEGATEIAGIDSRPVREIVAQMLRYSDNTTAELLVKEVAVRAGGAGTTVGGITSLTATLAGAGVNVDAVALTDGSGLDPGNRVTCRAIAQVVDLAGPSSALTDGLAVAGESGTLQDRMVDTPAAGQLRAKTGSLRNVSALAGTVQAANGRLYTFAYITNVPEGEFVPAVGMDFQTELGVALATVAPIEPPAEILPSAPIDE